MRSATPLLRTVSPPAFVRTRIHAFLTLLFAASVASLGGCSPPQETVEFAPLTGERSESQWELRVVDGGDETPLSAAMAASDTQPGEGRLYLMSPFGQTLGKCTLSNGEAQCGPSVPGVAPLLQRASIPMARMLAAEAARGGAGMFGSGASQPRALRGDGWRCERDGDWLVYREDGKKWTLRLKRIK